MYRQLGPVGVFGLLVAAAGLGIVTWRAPLVGAGLALLLAGIGIVVQQLIRSMLGAFGLA
jgi:hypothetical protein